MTSPRGRKPAAAGHEVRILRRHESAGTPLHVQVYRQLRSSIAEGTLPSGARLPSARTLAHDLHVSRNTVEAAFAQLRAEGLVTRRVGAGTVVATTISEVAPFAQAGAATRRTAVSSPPVPPAGGQVELSSRGAVLSALGSAEIIEDQRAAPGATDVRGFPGATWNTLLARHTRHAGLDAFRSADSFGLPELRQAIAAQAQLTRGVQCSPEQVIVVNSTQQAIDLAARLLLDVGDAVAMEDPGYTSARAALLGCGASVVPIAVDAEGMDVSLLADDGRVRVAYVTPSHQFPLGVTMSLTRRRALLDWAARTGAWVIEDDYDSGFRHGDRPILSLQGMDGGGRVLYVGTFNNVLFPGLRLAYLIVPQVLVQAFGAARHLTDGFSSPLLQGVLAEFLVRGHFAAYVRAARDHHESSRDALLRSIALHWADAVRLGPSETGLHLVAYLDDAADDHAIAHAVQTRGLGVTALSRYYHAVATRRGLLLSYGAATPDAIEADVRALTPLVLRR